MLIMYQMLHLIVLFCSYMQEFFCTLMQAPMEHKSSYENITNFDKKQSFPVSFIHIYLSLSRSVSVSLKASITNTCT